MLVQGLLRGPQSLGLEYDQVQEFIPNSALSDSLALSVHFPVCKVVYIFHSASLTRLDELVCVKCLYCGP